MWSVQLRLCECGQLILGRFPNPRHAPVHCSRYDDWMASVEVVPDETNFILDGFNISSVECLARSPEKTLA